MAAGLLHGCAIVPASLEGDVFRVLRVGEDAFPAEMKTLQTKLRRCGATVEDLLHFETSIVTFRRVERLELVTIQGLDPVGHALVDALDARAWRHILDYGEARLRMYAANPGLAKVAVGTVKGIIAEEIFDVSPRFREVLARARARGFRIGIPPSDIRYVRGTRGITISEKNLRFVNHGELTDGLIKGTRRIELSEAERAERLAERGRYAQWGATKRGSLSPIDEDVHIFTLKESKSPSNVDQIAGDHGDNWLGQMGGDTERFLELPSFIDGKWYTPRQVKLSIYRTEWIAVVPKGRPIGKSVLNRLGLRSDTRPIGRLFNMYEMEIADEVLNAIAERILQRRAGRP
jgi:hypothetical protein